MWRPLHRNLYLEAFTQLPHRCRRRTHRCRVHSIRLESMETQRSVGGRRSSKYAFLAFKLQLNSRLLLVFLAVVGKLNSNLLNNYKASMGYNDKAACTSSNNFDVVILMS